MSTVSVGVHIIVGQRFSDRSGNTWAEGKPTVRVTKNKPDCQAHEVAVFLQLELPRALFVRPQLRANITVPESDAPFIITPEVQQNIAQAVYDQLGITLAITAPEQEGGS